MRPPSLRCFSLLALLALGGGATGCHPRSPATGSRPSEELPAGGQEFTLFVKNLIENQTKNDNPPVSIDDKTFVDTPPVNAFPPSFFQ